jgi:hypothetical protein
VVIAAELPAVGTEGLPDIESKLGSLDVYSAWRGVTVSLGAIVELIKVGATTLTTVIGNPASRLRARAQRTAASDATDPSTPTTSVDRIVSLSMRAS